MAVPYKSMLTQEELKELFYYDSEGYLIWKTDRGLNRVKGMKAGSVGSHGRVQISVGSKLYLAHVLIWIFHYGNRPENTIDHKDLNFLNNRIENLREATKSEQNFNKPKYKGRNLPKWVSYRPPRNGRKERFEARITLNGKTLYLGSFQTKDEAYEKAKEAAKKHHGDFYNEG